MECMCGNTLGWLWNRAFACRNLLGPRQYSSESQTKLLRLERQNRELDRSLQVLKQSSERVNAEVEKTNKKLTAQIHADNKEIARLKEVR